MSNNLQPNQFKFMLSENGNDTELKNAPVGWETTTVQYSRSETYQGMIRSLTVPMTFVLRAAGMIRNAYYGTGILSRMLLSIQKQITLNWNYSTIFKGKLDFTQFNDGKSNVQVNVVEESFNEKVAANDEVKYDIPLNVPEAVEVELTPIPFKEKTTFLMTPTGGSSFLNTFFGMNIVTNEVHASVLSTQNVDQEYNTTPDFSTSNKYFYKASISGEVGFKFNDFTGGTLNLVAASFVVVNQNGTILKTFYNAPPSASSVPFDIEDAFSVSVNEGDRLFMYAKTNSPGIPGVNIYSVNSGSLVLTYNTQSPATKCKAIRASYLFDKLIQLINGQNTGGAYTPQPTNSVLLQTVFKDLVFTCSNSIRVIQDGTQYSPGDNLLTGAKYLVINDDIIYATITYHPGDTFVALQGIDTFISGGNGSVILVSYNEALYYSLRAFYKYIRAKMGGDCGFGVDSGVATLEQLSAYFRNINMVDLGTIVNEPQIKPDLSRIFSAITIGTDHQYDTLNGFQEVNSVQNYSGDLTAYKNVLDLTHDETRDDPYGIETLRFTPQDTSASRSDNDTFAIWLKPEPEIGQTYYHPLRTEGLQSITGIDNPDAYYNWQLTPKRSLYRGKSYLASCFYQQTTIRFISAIKNVNLITVDNDGVRVAERDDILVANLGAGFCIPTTFEITVALPENALNQLDMQYGAVKFRLQYENIDTVLNGFMLDTSVDAGQNSQRNFKLLSTASNNLLTLVH